MTDKLKAKSSSLCRNFQTATSCVSTAATERIDFSNLKQLTPINLNGNLVKRKKDIKSTLGRWDYLLEKTMPLQELMKGKCNVKRLVENSVTQRVLSPNQFDSERVRPQSVKKFPSSKKLIFGSEIFNKNITIKTKEKQEQSSKRAIADIDKRFIHQNITSQNNFLSLQANKYPPSKISRYQEDDRQKIISKKLFSPYQFNQSQINLSINNSTINPFSCESSPRVCALKKELISGSLLKGSLAPKKECLKQEGVQSFQKAQDCRFQQSQIQLFQKSIPVVQIDLAHKDKYKHQSSYNVKKILSSSFDQCDINKNYITQVKKRINIEANKKQQERSENQNSLQVKRQRPGSIVDVFRSNIQLI